MFSSNDLGTILRYSVVSNHLKSHVPVPIHLIGTVYLVHIIFARIRIKYMYIMLCTYIGMLECNG